MKKTKIDIVSTEEMMIFAMVLKTIKHDGFREKLIKILEDTHNENSKLLIKQAIKDKHIDNKEIARLIKKYDVDKKDVAEIFKMFYDEGIAAIDDGKSNSINMVTEEDSGIWKMKDYIKEKYGFEVITTKQALDKMDTASLNKFKKDANYIG